MGIKSTIRGGGSEDGKSKKRYLSAPDPCPHVTRMDMIGAKLDGDSKFLDEVSNHLKECKGQ